MDFKLTIKLIDVSTIWVLVKFLRQCNPESVTSGEEPEYIIVNKEDIIEGVTSDAKGLVRFKYQGVFNEGKAIYSASTREDVERKLQQLTQPGPIQVLPKRKQRYFIVEYSKASTNLIQKIVAEKDVLWPKPIEKNQSEVIIFDGSQERMAMVILMHEDKTYIKRQFRKLKQIIFEAATDLMHDHLYPKKREDYLLVYHAAPLKSMFTIIRNTDGCIAERDAAANFTDGHIVNGFLIICRAPKIFILIEELNFIRGSCRNLNFPLDIHVSDQSVTLPSRFRSRFGKSLSDVVETFEVDIIF